jgi:hypothetical protein
MTEASTTPEWTISSFSGANGNCVQVAQDDEAILFGHSTDPSQAPIRYTRAEMAAFVAGIKAGEFDEFC